MGEAQLKVVNRSLLPLICAASAAELNSRGYAQINTGNGPSFSLLYPLGKYKSPVKSTPSARLYFIFSFEIPAKPG